MKNQPIKIALRVLLSITIGVLLMKYGYIIENAYISIAMQSLGYVVISYPFYLFFKLLIQKIKYDIERSRENKKFYSYRGGVWGFIRIGDDPLSVVKCIVKNEDGTTHKWTHRWINVSDKMGFYEINYIPKGKYKCYFTHTFMNGQRFIEERDVEIFEDIKTNLNLKLEK